MRLRGLRELGRLGELGRQGKLHELAMDVPCVKACAMAKAALVNRVRLAVLMKNLRKVDFDKISGY